VEYLPRSCHQTLSPAAAQVSKEVLCVDVTMPQQLSETKREISLTTD